MSTKNRLSRLNVESLEQREVPAILSVGTWADTLYVNTNNSSTNVTIVPSGSNIQVIEGVGSGPIRWTGAASSVHLVRVTGGAGNDYFVSNAGNLQVYFKGNDGNDTLIGGNGDDTLVGGNGDDYLYGMDGNDQIVGGAGANGGAGTDRLYGGNGDDTLVTIDGGITDYADGGSGWDTMWRDDYQLVGGDAFMSDIPQNMDQVYDIAAFANASQGADRSLNGDLIADPANGWPNGVTLKKFADNPLFGAYGNPGATAPLVTDVRQGLVNDSWALAPLGAMAVNNTRGIRQMVADFGDGTYGVRLGSNFYRVDNELWTLKTKPNEPCYAGLGHDNSMWVAIVEKAYATASGNSYVTLGGPSIPTPAVAMQAYNVIGGAVQMNYPPNSATAVIADLTNGKALGQSSTITVAGVSYAVTWVGNVIQLWNPSSGGSLLSPLATLSLISSNSILLTSGMW